MALAYGVLILGDHIWEAFDLMNLKFFKTSFNLFRISFNLLFSLIHPEGENTNVFCMP